MMTMTNVERMKLLVLVCLAAVALIVWLIPKQKPDCGCLSVTFLNVGQGDSILVETPDGFEMLVDGGPDAAVLRELGRERSFFDRRIDLMVATHPDADHIGGLIDVLKRYDVQTILQTENKNDTPVAAAYAAATSREQAELITADAGQMIQLGASTTLQVFSPAGDETNWESNTSSIVMRVVYGSTSFMLTGDAPSEIEDYLVDSYGSQLDSTVLKLGHHGSKTSTSQKFLDTVTPQYAVVSAAVDNRYGHPHQEVMQRVFGRKVQTVHTGTDGTVTFYSDGAVVWRK
ncbi:MAG TPA: ComEC/Rec2 family competence protein [Candidatus Paceibacterota bacterium]